MIKVRIIVKCTRCGREVERELAGKQIHSKTLSVHISSYETRLNTRDIDGNSWKKINRETHLCPHCRLLHEGIMRSHELMLENFLYKKGI